MPDESRLPGAPTTLDGSEAPLRDEPPHEMPAPSRSKHDWFSPRMLALSAGSLVMVGIIVANAVFISRTVSARSAPAASASVAAASAGDAPSHESEPSSPIQDGDGVGDGETPIEPPDEPPPGDKPARPKKPSTVDKSLTVDQAFSRGCSTSSIEGLSRQIIGEARCMDANAFAPVPARKNLSTQGHVVLHLEAPARDQLLKALDAHPDRKMTVNSALRTVAQQYMLDRWARSGRCGIKLAAHPGESNHETGLALDISEHDAWRPELEKQGFRWLGPTDRVHFDFQGPGIRRHEKLDVVAFQRLWNRNHPEDRIPENGAYNDATESRIRKSPAVGFAQGPSCGGVRSKKH